MHFEVLVEDQSCCAAITILMEKILGPNGSIHSWRTHAYKGLGHIPTNLRATSDPARRILLDQLPRLIRGYGKSLDNHSAVVVVVDLDDRDCLSFKRELTDVLDSCNPSPTLLFRIAIEESEAWLLGDRAAVKTAYPNAKDHVLDSYVQDSICGTWEILADAVHQGGSSVLKNLGWTHTGAAKSDWANNIAPHIDIQRNNSQSFQAFLAGVRRLADNSPNQMATS